MIDEIQNVVGAAQRSKKVKPLIRFLTELTNDTCTSVYFVGTTMADEVFQAEEYLRRRTRGPRLLPFKPDAGYREFLSSIWTFQVTERSAELTDRVANLIYTYSGGIPAYITSLFTEAQAQALLHRKTCIDLDVVKQAADYLTIQPPSKIGRGVSISDFKEIQDSDEEVSDTERMVSETLNQIDSRRGRKVTTRDKADLLLAWKAGRLNQVLVENDMIEEVVLC